MLAWHLAKTNGRPTICNMSWAYYKEWSIESYKYRGVFYNDTQKDSSKGMLGEKHPISVSSVDSDIEDCLAAGIVMVAAAGNDNILIDELGGLDYGNYYEDPDRFGSFYWHRGGTPCGVQGLIVVGNVDSSTFKPQSAPSAQKFEIKQEGSSKGKGVHLFAPGTEINGALSQFTAFGDKSFDYPLDDEWRAGRLTGTSMAAPQVTGVLAGYMGRNPNITPKEAKKWVIENAADGRLYDSSSGIDSADYNDPQSLMGAANKYLRTPYSNGTVAQFSGDFNWS